MSRRRDSPSDHDICFVPGGDIFGVRLKRKAYANLKLVSDDNGSSLNTYRIAIPDVIQAAPKTRSKSSK